MVKPPAPRRPPVLLVVVRLCALMFLVSACERWEPTSVQGTATPGAASSTAGAEAALQSEDRVDLALYFRSGTGEGAHLERVVREVDVTGDLPRQAVELLLDGPTAADGEDLAAPLPTSTRLLGLEIADGVATVDLSREVITDADSVGGRPNHELLGLAALADTLTEFPGIEAVRLTVEGRQRGDLDGIDVGEFWGGWGLPERLVRDELVIGAPTDGVAVPDLARFGRRPQTIEATKPGTVAIRSVRVRDHTTYLRLVVEVGDGSDPQAPTAPPPSSVRVTDQGIVLTVDRVAGYGADLAVGQTLEIGDPAFDAITVGRGPGGDEVTFTVGAVESPEFWLHSLMSPTRVVLDVRK